MKSCIFTGSGFSKAVFNQEIQQDFIGDFIESNASREYIDYFSDETKKLMLSINDPEILVSHFFNLAYLGLPHNNVKIKAYKRKILFFRTALAIYFRNKFKSEDCTLRYDTEYRTKLKKLIREFHSPSGSNKLTVVTTNYDLGFERIIEDSSNVDSYHYPQIHRWYSSSNKIPILKLHGSINWMEERGKSSSHRFWNPSRGVQQQYLEVLDNAHVVPLKNPEEFALEYLNKKYTPILIPFMFQKEKWSEINQPWWGTLFNEIWINAYKDLVESNQIVFMGYGLPAADHHMFSFLYDVLTKTNARVTIIDITEHTNLISSR